MINALSALAGGTGLATMAVGGTYYASYAVKSQWLGATVYRGRTDTSQVALTFDDGPTNDTERILDVLGQFRVQATFFLLGRQVERNPEISRRIVAEGHEIGNHSYSHPVYLFSTPRETRRQIEDAQAIIERVTGVAPRFSRPPCGVRTPAYFITTRKLGLRTIQWDVAGYDWKTIDAETIATNVLRNASAGSVILLHDGDSQLKRDRRETVTALSKIIERLRNRGLGVAALSKLLAPSGSNSRQEEQSAHYDGSST